MAEYFSTLKAMVVDDESVLVDMTSELLRWVGFTDVISANDGAAALSLLDSLDSHPDIILSDLSMPEMDGIQFIRHLGERGVKSAIILVSGEDPRVLHSVEAMARSYDLYVLGAIEKPIEIEPLRELLSHYNVAHSSIRQSATQPITVEELQDGLANDAISLVFQPKADVVRRKIRGVETLVRWNDPTRGLLGPAAVVPLAEESGHINALTDKVFHNAMKQAAEWRALGLDLSIAVNFSVDNLLQLDLPERILACAAHAGIPPSKIVIELTESRVMSNLRASLEILGRLRLKGIQFSIDDFGTGYSSMEQLKRAPFTELKIDRAFVFEACKDPAAAAILESSASLGRKLKMTVVAEGAETMQDVDLAARCGCDLIQGYMVAKPMSGSQIPDWIKQWESSTAAA